MNEMDFENICTKQRATTVHEQKVTTFGIFHSLVQMICSKLLFCIYTCLWYCL